MLSLLFLCLFSLYLCLSSPRQFQDALSFSLFLFAIGFFTLPFPVSSNYIFFTYLPQASLFLVFSFNYHSSSHLFFRRRLLAFPSSLIRYRPLPLSPLSFPLSTPPPCPRPSFFFAHRRPVQSAHTLGLVFENSQMLHKRLLDPIMWVDLIMHEAEAGATFPLQRTRRGKLIYPFFLLRYSASKEERVR